MGKNFNKITSTVLITSYLLLITASVANAAGLVPCTDECDICDLFIGVHNIVDFLTIDIAMPLAVIILIYGGVMLLTSGESETRREKGRKALWAAVWGLLIVFAAWLIIDTIIKYLISGSFEFPFGPWNAIPSC